MSKYGYVIREVAIGYDVFYKDNQIGHDDLRSKALDIVIDHACTRAEAAEALVDRLNALNLASKIEELEDEVEHQKALVDSWIARAAQLESERAELIEWRDTGAIEIETLTAERDELRAELSREEYKRLVAESERDEARRQLEQAQREITQLNETLKDIATAPYEDQPNDGNEWEKEYYLRGLHR